MPSPSEAREYSDRGSNGAPVSWQSRPCSALAFFRISVGPGSPRVGRIQFGSRASGSRGEPPFSRSPPSPKRARGWSRRPMNSDTRGRYSILSQAIRGVRFSGLRVPRTRPRRPGRYRPKALRGWENEAGRPTLRLVPRSHGCADGPDDASATAATRREPSPWKLTGERIVRGTGSRRGASRRRRPLVRPARVLCAEATEPRRPCR